MAENIYSKGTRVWLTDKEQGWISAEVTNVVRKSDDKIKLSFVDDRGKVSYYAFIFFATYASSDWVECGPDLRKSQSIQLPRPSETVKTIYHLYEIHLYWRRLTILLPYPILMSPQVRYIPLRTVISHQPFFSPSHHPKPLCTA